DTGVGIPEEDLGRVFERFHRVKHSRARTQEGTGIGLSLVQELARLHGGTVTGSSAVGRGTTVTVTIRTGTSHLSTHPTSAAHPLTRTAIGVTPYVEEALRWLPGNEPAPAPLAGSLPSARSAGGSTPLEDARILIADDNADMRDYLARILGEHHHVEAVADGR